MEWFFWWDVKAAEAKAKAAISFPWYSGLLLAITKNAVVPWLCCIIKIFSCSICLIMWSIIAGTSYVPISFQLYKRINCHVIKIQRLNQNQNLGYILISGYSNYTWTSRNLGRRCWNETKFFRELPRTLPNCTLYPSSANIRHVFNCK